MINVKLKYTEILKYIKRGKLEKYIKKNTMNHALPLMREAILQYENVEDSRKDLFLALNSSSGNYNFEVYYNNGNMGNPIIFDDFNEALKYFLLKCKSDQRIIVYNLLCKFTNELKAFNQIINTSEDKSIRDFKLIAREVVGKTKYSIISMKVVEMILTKELAKMSKEQKFKEEKIKISEIDITEALKNMEKILNDLKDIHPNAAHEVFSIIYGKFGFKYKDLTMLCKDYSRITNRILNSFMEREGVKL